MSFSVVGFVGGRPRCWTPDVEALAVINAELSQQIESGLIFDAFGDGLEAEPGCEVDNCLDDMPAG